MTAENIRYPVPSTQPQPQGKPEIIIPPTPVVTVVQTVIMWIQDRF